jgi:hypothetical protein
MLFTATLAAVIDDFQGSAVLMHAVKLPQPAAHMLLTATLAAVIDDFQGSAVLMHTSAQLMAMLPSQGPKQLKLQKTAYALAAAAGLQVHEAMPQHAGGSVCVAAAASLHACAYVHMLHCVQKLMQPNSSLTSEQHKRI